MQQVIQITQYNVVFGNQRQSNQQPLPITAPVYLTLKGRPISRNATLAKVVIQFETESKTLRKPAFDADSYTLLLSYPLTQYPLIMDMLQRNTVYCQFLVYDNGHVWADLHTGSVRLK